MIDIKEQKKILRKQIREKIKNCKTDFKAQDKLIVEKILKLEQFKKASLILAYYPLNNEVNTIDFIDIALKMDKRVALPITRNDFMYFIEIDNNWKSALTKGNYNIIEPKDEIILNNIEDNTLIIVPNLALGKDNTRLGHGKGYYDRFFSKYQSLYKVGICRKEFLLDTLPIEENDVKLDKIIYA